MNVVEMTRDKVLTVRMSVEEMGGLEQLAKLKRSSASDLVRQLVADELQRAKRQDEAERRQRARYRTRDIERLERVYELAGEPGDSRASADYDEARGVFVVTIDGKVVATGATVDEIETGVGGRIVGWSESNLPLVAKTMKAAKAAEAWIEKTHGGDWSKATPAELKKLGVEEESE